MCKQLFCVNIRYRSIITSFLHAWHHMVFCVYVATLSRGKLNFHETICGISTRRDVVFPRDMGFTQDMVYTRRGIYTRYGIYTRHGISTRRGISSKTGCGTYKRTSRENPREFLTVVAANLPYLMIQHIVYVKTGCLHSLDWTTGLEYWTGLLD